MNAPLIIETPLSVKDRLDDLLTAIDFGLYPKDGATDEQKSQAEKDAAVVAQAIKDVHAADSDFEADRVFMVAMARLAGAGRRFRVDAGRFVPDKRPLPVFDAAAQALGMQGSPVPVRAAQQLTQVGGVR